MKASITPKESILLFGRGDRERRSTHVSTPLEANLISLPSAKGLVLIVGLDTLFASSAFKAAVLTRVPTNIRSRIDELVFVATHTHNAPALDPTKPLLGQVNTAYFENSAKIVATMIAGAIEHKQPAIARFSRGFASCKLNSIRRKRGLRIERRYPFFRFATNMVPHHGPDVPRQLDIAVAYDAADAPLWAIWSWTCHATASPDPDAICADFPGRVRSFIRTQLGNPELPVVFLPGFCGDVRADPSYFPIKPLSLVARPFQRPYATQTKGNFEYLCAQLVSTTRSALDAAQPCKLSPVSGVGHASTDLNDLIDTPHTAAASTPIQIRAFSLGDFGLLLIGAEVCSPYLHLLRGIAPTTWILTGYSDQVFGYLPTDRQIKEGGYESTDFFGSFGIPGKFKAKIEAMIVAASARAIAKSRTPQLTA